MSLQIQPDIENRVAGMCTGAMGPVGTVPGEGWSRGGV